MTRGLPFRIVVDGELGDWLAHHVGAATIDATDGTTTITGVLDGPMELQSITETLCDLGLEIKSARLL